MPYRACAADAAPAREFLAARGACPCVWYLDSPVSNSGRLRALILQAAEAKGWDWQVELVYNPDPILAESPDLVATADAGILDRCARWIPLARLAIVASVPGANVIDLAP